MAGERPRTTSTPASSGPHLTVQQVTLDTLTLDPANVRGHGEENMAAIIGSLRRFGQCEPLVVQAGSLRVVGGNGRLVAMRKLGWTECDAVILDLTDLEATALGIALNRTAELAHWDEAGLAKMLEQLRSEDSLDGIGYSDEDLDQLLAELEQESGTTTEVDDPGPQEPPTVPVSRPGDLWVLGSNQRLLCGDSTNPEHVARVLDGKRATLLSTDPPYCVGYTGKDRPIHDGKPSGKDWSAVYREIDIEDLGEFLDGVLSACLPRVSDDAAVYLWHAHVQQPTILATFERHGLLLHQVIVWVKPVGVFGHSYYRWRHEPCAFGWKKGHKPTHGTGKLDTVWEIDWEGKARVVGNLHPTQKPLRVFEIPMEQHTRPGAVVLEPFSGSGSQLLAAEKLGRKCRALEISPAFVDAAITRFQAATGSQAVLEETGQTFEAVAAARGTS